MQNSMKITFSICVMVYTVILLSRVSTCFLIAPIWYFYWKSYSRSDSDYLVSKKLLNRTTLRHPKTKLLYTFGCLQSLGLKVSTFSKSWHCRTLNKVWPSPSHVCDATNELFTLGIANRDQCIASIWVLRPASKKRGFFKFVHFFDSDGHWESKGRNSKEHNEWKVLKWT